MILSIYVFLLGLLYGGIASAQVLGLFKIYTPFTALVFTLVLGAAAIWGYLRSGGGSFLRSFLPAEKPHNRLLETSAYIGGVLLLALQVIPLAGYPYSPISETLNWDAGNYHFPKAIELYRTGSAWDLSISYGEYPFGYESLLALTLCLRGDAFLFGAVHALITLFLSLTLWFLAQRYTRLPPGLLFFGVNALLVSGALPFESNLWWIIKHLIYTIGKNDLFLGSALLGVVLHAPVGTRENQDNWHPLGLALTGMIALSIKPNALLVFLPVVLWAEFKWLKKHRQNQQDCSYSWTHISFSGLAVLPGLLWLVRNLLIQGVPFSSEVSALFEWSIAANLLNPFFYRYIPQHLYWFGGLAVITILTWAIFRRPTGSICAVFLMLFASFTLTPASAFLDNNQSPSQIAWRFATACLLYAALLLLNMLDSVLYRLTGWVSRNSLPAGLLACALLVFSGWLNWDQRQVYRFNAQNIVVLRDQFRSPVGVDGYHSAYDYVQQNIRNAVIHVDNGLPFYLYDPGFTNSVTHLRPADYYVVFRTAWFPGWKEGYPDRLASSEFDQTWTLIYEDTQGRVYQRKQ